MYLVRTIGALGDVGAPPESTPTTVDGRPLVLVAVAGLLVGALGLWTWERYGRGRRR